MQLLKNWVALLILIMMTSIAMIPTAHAERSYFKRHPYQKTGLIGGGIGAGAGALLSRKGHRGSGAMKGALVGGAAGTGYEFLKKH